MIVIEKGAIAEQGTHDELLSHDGVYKKLVLRQLTAGAVVDRLVNADTNEEEDDDKLIDLKEENHDLLD